MKPPTGVGTEEGEETVASWMWSPLMDEAIGNKPSIHPQNLGASLWPTKGGGGTTSKEAEA